ncbi:MAG: SGNH/GDSL hydrolase family protein [Bradymonadia bacterium]
MIRHPLLWLVVTLAVSGCAEDLGEFASARPEMGVEGADANLQRPDVNFADAQVFDQADLGVDDPDAFEDPIERPDAAPFDPADAMAPMADMDRPRPDMDLPPPPAEGTILYPSDRTLSPLTANLVQGLRAIVDDGPDRDPQVFAKVGASATVSVHNMQCFAGDRIDLDGRDHLQSTIDHFRAGDAAGSDPYTRESLTATVGWSARSAVAGDPSPVEREIEAISPRFALIMYGTNDIQGRNPFRYADSMLTLADILIDEGVIPVLTTIMPRDDDASADALVPQYNAIVRAVAQGRGVPLADFHRELLPIPGHGLAGDDLHPNVFRDGGARACHFTPEALEHGYNIRNLLMIETLDRVRRTVFEGEAAPDREAPRLRGDGTHDDPFVVTTLPFTHLSDTTEGARRIDRYTGCNANQDESGPEQVYRLDLARETTIKVMVFDRDDIDVDLHLLDDTGEAAGCLQRDHQEMEASLAPGSWFLVVDSFVSGGEEQSGEYMLTILEE